MQSDFCCCVWGILYVSLSCDIVTMFGAVTIKFCVYSTRKTSCVIILHFLPSLLYDVSLCSFAYPNGVVAIFWLFVS